MTDFFSKTLNRKRNILIFFAFFFGGGGGGGGGRGRAGVETRVSDLFTKNPNLKKKTSFFREGGGSGVSDFPLL